MLRSLKERILQTLCFEVLGLVLFVPAFAAMTPIRGLDALLTLTAMSVAVMLWTGVHNFLFDWIEFQMTRRVASGRPNKMRLIMRLVMKLLRL